MIPLLLLACSDPPPAAPATVPAGPVEVAAPAPLVAPQADGPPTVVLLSLDTTRADAVSAWGPDPGSVTPTLDGLADRGVRFAWALAPAPSTLPSHASVFSGRDLAGHGVLVNGQRVPAELPLLAAHLSDHGYDTAAAVGARVLPAAGGIGRGFARYDEPPRGSASRPAAAVTDAALAAADQRDPARPLLLFAHYYDPHTPWTQAPEALRERFLADAPAGTFDGSEAALKQLITDTRRGRLDPAEAARARALYRAHVAAADAEVARLLAGLEQRGLLERAVIAVFGDHGETLDETATTTAWSHGPDVDLVDLHVPLLLVAPGLPAGHVVQRPVRLVDLTPTLLPLLGLPPLPGAEGEDLQRLLSSEEAPAPPAYAMASQPQLALRGPEGMRPLFEYSVAHQGHLLVRGPARGGMTDRLYALAPGQPAVEDPAVQSRLAAMLDGWADRIPRQAPAVPAQTRQQLEALGYIDGGTAPASR